MCCVYCGFVAVPIAVPGQEWNWIETIPDLCIPTFLQWLGLLSVLRRWFCCRWCTVLCTPTPLLLVFCVSGVLLFVLVCIA